MPILPTIQSDDAYKQVYQDTDLWLPAMTQICHRHHLDATQLHRTTLGSHIVFRTGNLIIKLFFHLWLEDYEAEAIVLAHLRDLPTPQIVAQGWLEDWPYLIITAVPGTPALELWPTLTFAQKEDIVTQLGQLMRRLHEHPPLPALATDWDAFLAERIANSPTHHRVAEPWQSWIQKRLASFRQLSFTPVLLSADITEDHVLLSEENGRYQITGFIDFGDAKMGHPYYDFIAPFAFYTFGYPKLTEALVSAYGLKTTPEVQEAMTTYCLLHEFGGLADFLERYPVQNEAEFIKALWG